MIVVGSWISWQLLNSTLNFRVRIQWSYLLLMYLLTLWQYYDPMDLFWLREKEWICSHGYNFVYLEYWKSIYFFHSRGTHLHHCAIIFNLRGRVFLFYSNLNYAFVDVITSDFCRMWRSRMFPGSVVLYLWYKFYYKITKHFNDFYGYT